MAYLNTILLYAEFLADRQLLGIYADSHFLSGKIWTVEPDHSQCLSFILQPNVSGGRPTLNFLPATIS